MKKILFICNTYYQLIVAMQIKSTLLKTDQVTVYLSDHSRNAKKIVDNLNKENFFWNVQFIETKNIDYCKGKIFKGIKDLFKAVTGNIKIFKNLSDNNIYDEIFYFNISITLITLFNYFYKKNANIVCSRYEEGILSYNIQENKIKDLSMRVKCIYFLNKILGKKYIFKSSNKFYCFNPEIYTGVLETIKIPFIELNNSKIKGLLNNIFEVNEMILDYKQKYIYFEGVGDFDNKNQIGELKLVKDLANLIGKENLLIKKHPRDSTNVYENEGLIVDKSSSIPWEIIQLNYNFSEHIFLTAISGSVLSINLILDKKQRPVVYFLYPLCNISKNKKIKLITNQLETLLLNNQLNNIYLEKDLNNITGEKRL